MLLNKDSMAYQKYVFELLRRFKTLLNQIIVCLDKGLQMKGMLHFHND